MVTGGSGAIGQQVCLYLNRAGVTVIGAAASFDLESAETLRSEASDAGIEIAIVAFDAADENGKAIAGIKDKYGRIDIRVNFTGITCDAPLRKMTNHQWQ